MKEYKDFESYFKETTGKSVDAVIYQNLMKSVRAFSCTANILSQTFRQKKWWDDRSSKMQERIREELGWYFNPWWGDMKDSGIDPESDMTIETVRLAVKYTEYLQYKDRCIASHKIPGAIEAKNALLYA